MKKYTKRKLFLRNKIINLFMVDGKKKTVEKILMKSVKILQKSSKKRIKMLFQHSIINLTPIFVVNTQVVKKGKRKITKDVPSFLFNYSLRVTNSLKIIEQSTKKSKDIQSFYESFAKEILNSFLYDSVSVNKKNDIQKQVLLKKRYLSNFKW